MKQKVVVKAVKAAKSVKAVKAVKAAKSVKAVKAAKSVKAVKAAKSVKAVKAAKSVKAVKAAKAPKLLKNAKALKGTKLLKMSGGVLKPLPRKLTASIASTEEKLIINPEIAHILSVINKVNKDNEDDIELYRILMDYERSVKNIYKDDFKRYTMILLQNLKLINDDSIIDAEVTKLNDFYRETGLTTDEKAKFLEDIFNKYINPYLNYHNNGIIKFLYLHNKINAKRDSKIKADRNKELSKKQDNEDAIYAEKVETEDFWKKRAADQQAVNRRRGDTSTGLGPAVSHRGLTGWEAPHPSLYNHYDKTT